MACRPALPAVALMTMLSITWAIWFLSILHWPEVFGKREAARNIQSAERELHGFLDERGKGMTFLAGLRPWQKSEAAG